MFPVLAGNSASTGYNLTRSLRFRASASAYLNRTLTTPTNNLKWTLSAWVKRGSVLTTENQIMNAGTAGSDDQFVFTTSSQLGFYVANGAAYYLITNAVYRDPAAWYHIVFVWDTANATAANRLLMYVNGTQVTSFATALYPTQNYASQINSAVLNRIGLRSNSASPFDGYLTEVNFIDGQALTPSSFGSTNTLTGVWQPARYAGTYGTNGFYLPFTDNSALTTASNVGLGKDFSGNANYWVTNNISITAGVTYDSMTDVPTLTSATAANYAVLNPLDVSGTYLSNGNQRITTGAAQGGVRSTMAFPTTAKIYFEVINASATSDPSTIQCGIGIANRSANLAGGLNGVTGIWGVLWAASRRYLSANGSSSAVIVGELAINSTMQVAVDLANGYAWVGVNNTWYDASNGTTGNPSTGANATFTSLSGNLFGFADVYSMAADANFGQRPFSYAPPTGFVALNTYNLPTSTILQGNKVMDATLYTGTGANQNIVNAAGFKPDFVWGKVRNAADQNFLLDSVRGSNNWLVSNSTNPENTDTTTLVSFNSNGFTVGTNTNLNRSGGYNFVAWQWQAGQGSSSSNTSGTITSTVSVNASAGFSVVTYTGTGANGATVGHGLGVTPSMMVFKRRNTTSDWATYHSSIGNTGVVFLNLTSATTTTANAWNNTSPTSSVFSLGVGTDINGSGSTYVAYCWTPIAGYSAFGSYTGNGADNGTFVYTGFRPKFVMWKNITDYGSPYPYASWGIIDSSAMPYNAAAQGTQLWANNSAAQGYRGNGSSADTQPGNIDLLSNGFKFRTSYIEDNAASTNYIYIAFAENPFKNSLAR